MSKHTPGPWIVVPFTGVSHGFYIGTDIQRDGMNVIAEIQQTKWTRDEQANANLIAAAPDLLEALEVAEAKLCMAEHMLDLREDDSPSFESEILTARAAIARARGEA